MVRPALAGKSILIVEDEPQLRHLLEAYVKRLGPRVETAANVESARRILAASAGRIDVLIADSQLPDGNGEELVREFLATTEGTVGILSSGIRMELTEWERATGRVLTLEKPYAPKELLALLEGLITESAPAAEPE